MRIGDSAHPQRIPTRRLAELSNESARRTRSQATFLLFPTKSDHRRRPRPLGLVPVTELSGEHQFHSTSKTNERCMVQRLMENIEDSVNTSGSACSALGIKLPHDASLDGVVKR